MEDLDHLRRAVAVLVQLDIGLAHVVCWRLASFLLLLHHKMESVRVLLGDHLIWQPEIFSILAFHRRLQILLIDLQLECICRGDIYQLGSILFELNHETARDENSQHLTATIRLSDELWDATFDKAVLADQFDVLSVENVGALNSLRV